MRVTMAEIMKLDDTRQLDFDRETVEQAYDRWAPVYDLVFGGVFSKGRKAAIQATNKIGGRVLEVGVGTGISLPHRRIRLVALCAMAGGSTWDGIGRAPPGAAARPFLAGPDPKNRDGGCRLILVAEVSRDLRICVASCDILMMSHRVHRITVK